MRIKEVGEATSFFFSLGLWEPSFGIDSFQVVEKPASLPKIISCPIYRQGVYIVKLV